MGSPVFGLLALAQDWWLFLFYDHQLCKWGGSVWLSRTLVGRNRYWSWWWLFGVVRGPRYTAVYKAPVSRFGSASSGSGFKLGEVGLQSHGFCPEEAADFLYAFGNYAPHTACGTPRPPGKQHLLGDPWALGARSLDFPLSMRVRPRHFVIEMDPPRQSSIP